MGGPGFAGGRWAWARRCVVLVAVVLSGGWAVSLGGSGPGRADAAAPAQASAQTPIKHVVIILKENRSFDEYFGKFPGANGATQGTMSNGQVVQLAQTPDPMPNDIGHTPEDWKRAYDGGKMDGFDREAGAFSSSGKNLAYTQMSQSTIPNYWAYAQTYDLGDNMFAPWKGGSFPNNVFSVAAQSGQYDASLGGRWMYASVPKSPTVFPLNAWGCDTPPDTLETMIDAAGVKSGAYPCFGFQALPNVLAENGVSWKYYGDASDGRVFTHNGLDAIGPVRNDPSLWSNVVSDTTFTTDASSGNLPAVSWVIGRQLEHPLNTTCAGENETVRYVNAIMNGPDWSSTAIFVYWDEWGGFYDHVAPRQVDGVSYGFRVPLLIISPYTKHGKSANGGSISHTFFTHLSPLKFIEDNWGLPSLTPKDAAANDMMGAFNFTGTQRPALIRQQRTCPKLTAAQRAVVASSDPD
ncbi:MAG TPA: alkaline phosphatase family protein [Gaiellales bacterium]|nr:alkaline phosphatase family protein [Gaiellales bacterium]